LEYFLYLRFHLAIVKGDPELVTRHIAEHWVMFKPLALVVGPGSRYLAFADVLALAGHFCPKCRHPEMTEDFCIHCKRGTSRLTDRYKALFDKARAAFNRAGTGRATLPHTEWVRGFRQDYPELGVYASIRGELGSSDNMPTAQFTELLAGRQDLLETPVCRSYMTPTMEVSEDMLRGRIN
jgi:hypothetical protein